MTGRRFLLLVLPALLLGAIILASSLPRLRGSAAQDGVRVRVAATTTIIADFVRAVGGEAVEVRSIIPAGADSHHYEPTPGDARFVASTDVVFANGAGLESWLDRFLSNVARSAESIIVLSDGLVQVDEAPYGWNTESATHHGVRHVSSTVDPHFWLNPRLAMHYVERIRDHLALIDPARAEGYRDRAAAYLRQLDDLDRWIREQVATIPAHRRQVVTYHRSFGHFATRYGLQLAGFVVPDHEREPSPHELRALIDLLRQYNIPALFTEPHVNRKLVETLAREAGVDVGVLYIDSLTPAVPTYIDMMRHNARELVRKLR